MADKGYIKKSVSIGIDLWNDIPNEIIDNNFSGFVQDSIRSKLKCMKIQDIREFIDNLDTSQLTILKKELDNR